MGMILFGPVQPNMCILCIFSLVGEFQPCIHFSCLFLYELVFFWNEELILFQHLQSFSSFGLIAETLGKFPIGVWDSIAGMRAINPLMATLVLNFLQTMQGQTFFE